MEEEKKGRKKEGREEGDTSHRRSPESTELEELIFLIPYSK